MPFDAPDDMHGESMMSSSGLSLCALLGPPRPLVAALIREAWRCMQCERECASVCGGDAAEPAVHVGRRFSCSVGAAAGALDADVAGGGV